MNNSIKIEQLVLQAGKNNLLAQHELYNRFCSEMLGLCIRMIGRRDIAEDVLQDAFIKAFGQIKKVKEPKRFAGWFKRIVINECLMQLKQNNQLAWHYNEVPDMVDEVNEFEPISFETINAEIDKLPNGCKHILVLYVLEEFKHKEIAEMLDLSVSTVKSQYQYALKLLRNNLKEVLV